jgi:predicted nicotinamide N-methyase
MRSIADLQIPGGWSERTIVVGRHAFTLLLPTEPDAFLEQLEDIETSDQPHFADPYWAKLWPAAINLAAAMVRRPFLPGTRILELGCGSGLVGLAALASGLDVTFSDYVPKAVELALENASRNGYPNGHGLVLDWRDPQLEQWPVILAADVTYDRTHIELLLNVLTRMLATGGVAWFGDSGRGPAEEFIERARSRGWTVSLFNLDDQPQAAPVLGQFQRMELRRTSD